MEAALSHVVSWLAARLHASGTRLRPALWPIAQTSVAAGVAYYLAYSLVRRP
jgi:hypothetical protein